MKITLTPCSLETKKRKVPLMLLLSNVDPNFSQTLSKLSCVSCCFLLLLAPGSQQWSYKHRQDACASRRQVFLRFGGAMGTAKCMKSSQSIHAHTQWDWFIFLHWWLMGFNDPVKMYHSWSRKIQMNYLGKMVRGMKVRSSWNPEVTKRILGPGRASLLGLVLLTLLQHITAVQNNIKLMRLVKDVFFGVWFGTSPVQRALEW